MKIAYCEQYGATNVVSIKDAPKPNPKDNEILVKIVAVAVTAADARLRAARFPKGFSFFARMALGITRPRNNVLGSSFSGVVEKAGDSIANFKAGDEVCGMSGIKMGAHAEYISVRSDKSVAIKPATISHEDAAGMLFGGTSALFFIRDKARVSKGDKVVINGASGAVGTNAVQLARYFGADVTAVTSGTTAEFVKSLGAGHIINYENENLLDSNHRYDVVLDAVGNVSIKSGLKLLTDNGRLVLMIAGLGQIFASSFYKQVLVGSATEKKEDIEFLLSLVERGELKVAIDSV